MEPTKDLTTEVRRTYIWPDQTKVVIEQPVGLIVSANGHRISDAFGNGHYVPNGWTHLVWENKPGAPVIAF